MLHTLSNQLSDIACKIVKLKREEKALSDLIDNACEEMEGKSFAEKKQFNDTFLVEFNSEYTRMLDIKNKTTELRHLLHTLVCETTN